MNTTRLIAITLLALTCCACTSVSEERIGDAEKMLWTEGVDDPQLVEHYSAANPPRWDYDQVVRIYGSVAPIYGQSGFVDIVKKRAAKWGCNAIYEMKRGTAKNTSYYTSVSVGRGYARAYTTPVTTFTPYGSFIGIRRIGWRPPVEKE